MGRRQGDREIEVNEQEGGVRELASYRTSFGNIEFSYAWLGR